MFFGADFLPMQKVRFADHADHIFVAVDDGEGADVVLGSRWVAGGKVSNWPKSREVLSRGANAYARFIIGIPLRDTTGGYRVYRAAVLRSFDLTTVRSQGYCFQVDLALRSLQSTMNTEWGALMCGSAIATIPLIVLFAITSRQLIAGLTAGAVK